MTLEQKIGLLLALCNKIVSIMPPNCASMNFTCVHDDISVHYHLDYGALFASRAYEAVSQYTLADVMNPILTDIVNAYLRDNNLQDIRPERDVGGSYMQLTFHLNKHDHSR